MQVSATAPARNGNPGIVPPHLAKPVPAVGGQPAAPAERAAGTLPIDATRIIVLEVPRELLPSRRRGVAPSPRRYEREQAAARQAIDGARQFFSSLGVKPHQGNDTNLDVHVTGSPRFQNAGFISARDAQAAGMPLERDLILIGNSPDTGTSYAFDEDVVRHEYAHRVVDGVVQLQRGGQSGALGESLADTFAAAMDDDWLIGETSTPGGMRDMMHPERFGDPGHARDYVRTRQDDGGVHINNGIPNKAAALIGEQLGRRAMAEIYMDAMRKYMPSDSGFADAAKATLLAAADRYGDGSREVAAVHDAWDAVGIMDHVRRDDRGQSARAPKTLVLRRSAAA